MAYLDILIEDKAKSGDANARAAELNRKYAEDILAFLRAIVDSDIKLYEEDDYEDADDRNYELQETQEWVADTLENLEDVDPRDMFVVFTVRNDEIINGLEMLIGTDDWNEELIIQFDFLHRLSNQTLV